MLVPPCTIAHCQVPWNIIACSLCTIAYLQVPGKYDMLHMDYSDEPEPTPEAGTDQPDAPKKEKKPVSKFVIKWNGTHYAFLHSVLSL